MPLHQGKYEEDKRIYGWPHKIINQVISDNEGSFDKYLSFSY